MKVPNIATYLILEMEPCIKLSAKEHLCNNYLPFSLCLIPLGQDYTIYGKLEAFDNTYKSSKIRTKKESYVPTFGLTGEYSEIFQTEKINQWTLKSVRHSELGLLNSSTPIGRKNWTIGETEILLTVTGCSENEFACTNGTCIPDEFRCSGTIECLDFSDEENCHFIEKNQGYMNNTPPSPYKTDVLTFYYKTTIYSIADISATDGIAKLDISIDLKWYDTRLSILNPRPKLKIDCNEIWSPEMAVADEVKYGFQLKFEPYRSFCHLDEKISKSQKDWTDSYMGNYALCFAIFNIDNFICNIFHIHCKYIISFRKKTGRESRVIIISFCKYR